MSFARRRPTSSASLELMRFADSLKAECAKYRV